MTKLALGSHVGSENPIETAKKLGLDHLQIFLADPQSWKGNEFPHPDGAEGLKKAAKSAKIDIYVHARYIINVAVSYTHLTLPTTPYV